jgi:hypothetical protein
MVKGNPIERSVGESKKPYIKFGSNGNSNLNNKSIKKLC